MGESLLTLLPPKPREAAIGTTLGVDNGGCDRRSRCLTFVSRVLLALGQRASSLRVWSGHCRVVPDEAFEPHISPWIVLQRGESGSAPPSGLTSPLFSDLLSAASASASTFWQPKLRACGSASVILLLFQTTSTSSVVTLGASQPRASTAHKPITKTLTSFRFHSLVSLFLRPAHKRRPLLIPSFVVPSASRHQTQPP